LAGGLSTGVCRDLSDCVPSPISCFLFWLPFCLYSRYVATAQSLPVPPRETEDQTAIAEEAANEGDRALVPSPLTAQVARLPVELDVSVPVRGFRVRNLLALEAAHLIESGWGHGEDVPLAAGAVQLAWCEFEVIGTLLAVRVTRLA
jgi:Type III flagellar switch regulator (C-ring) FliN C-term